MATLLHRLGKTAFRRWPFFIAGWLVFMVVLGATAVTISKPMTDAVTIPGIPSEKAADLQAELFPDTKDAFDETSVTVVVSAPEGESLDQPAYATAIADLLADLGNLPQMPEAAQDPETAGTVGLVNPVDAAAAQSQAILDGAKQSGLDDATAQKNVDAVSPLSKDGRVGTITYSYDVDTPADLEVSTQDKMRDVMAEARDSGLSVEANGSGMSSFAPPAPTSEIIGIGIALLVLLLTFGSLVASGLPIVHALIGVGIGTMGVTAMTAFTDIGTTTPILATMLGLAVGIDYTLFILARYRTELHHTDDREEAVGIAVGTAGSAVVFAGLTVLIALAALSVVGIPFLTAMGLAAAGTVFFAVLISLTLLPAVLGMLKTKAFGGRVRRYNPKRDEQGLVLNNGVRWARIVGKRPVAAIVLVVLALGVLAVPFKDLHLAFPTDSTMSSDTTQRKASDTMAEAFGPGREGPLLVVVDGRDIADDDERMAAFGDVAAWGAEQDDVVNAQLAGTNAPLDPETGEPTGPATGATVLITPESGPDETETKDLLETLRDGQSDIEAQTGTTTGVTGLTAITTDVSDRLSGALPIYLAIVIGLAFILLMIVFRSILVPLTATLGFLLSVLATLGATVAIFQNGLFGLVEGAPIVSFMPIFLIGVVFGLAMDYQVFLVTRIREAHVHGMSTRDAVVDGFRNSARVVAAAAAIMVAVFAAFIFQDEPLIRSIGFALAAAIVFDAFLVRMVLIPALLYLMGDKAWWLPAWLDRILPNVDVEGEKLDRSHMRKDDAEYDELTGELVDTHQ